MEYCSDRHYRSTIQLHSDVILRTDSGGLIEVGIVLAMSIFIHNPTEEAPGSQEEANHTLCSQYPRLVF